MGGRIEPIVVDESTWKPTTHQGISIWGHKPEGQTIIDKLNQFAIAARSLLHREDTVAALSTPRHRRRLAADESAPGSSE